MLTLTGRSYYYNETTRQSTYIRPAEHSNQALSPANGNFSKAAEQITDSPIIHHSLSHDENQIQASTFSHHVLQQHSSHRGGANGNGPHGYQYRPHPKDRLKSKALIPGCPPWLLVRTKLGRRFVHNPEINQSFWEFPPDVMKAMIEFDKLERENKNQSNSNKEPFTDGAGQASVEAEVGADQVPTAAAAPALNIDNDASEYEEVEVTDDEGDDQSPKRHKLDGVGVDQPLEFDEDDIAYQLAAMGQDYGLDPGEYGVLEGQQLEEGAEGLDLSKEDSEALFKDLLNDYQINPYIPWEKIVEAGNIVDDDRYTVLPNMRSRKEVWDMWSRDAIRLLKEQREAEEKKDPRISYFAFLQSHATPKLYWPEFRRKYRKQPEMHSTKLPDKDRERWYREYINRLKLPESTLKADLVALLKSTPLNMLNRSTSIELLPATLLTDVRFISLRTTIREPLIEAYVSTLPLAPPERSIGEVDVQAESERKRRERALAERQSQVQEEKKRQKGALQHSKGILREGEEEVERAMKVGKEGLLGHITEQ